MVSVSQRTKHETSSDNSGTVRSIFRTKIRDLANVRVAAPAKRRGDFCCGAKFWWRDIFREVPVIYF